MREHPAPARLAALAPLLASHLGLRLGPERPDELRRGLERIAASADTAALERTLDRLTATPPPRDLVETLARGFTVGETYFFREPAVFRAFEERILPELVTERIASVAADVSPPGATSAADSGATADVPPAPRRLRIWSAACCTGEEPYSIAIALEAWFPGGLRPVPYLLATDVNPDFLEKARAGVYTRWSFREVPEPLVRCHFRAIDEKRFEVLPEIRDRVTIASRNLVDLPSEEEPWDVVFCRNVLMYLSTETARRVIGELHDRLSPGGWLVVSQSELSGSLFPEFEPVWHGGTLLYRKPAEGERIATLSRPERTTGLPPFTTMNAFVPAPTRLRDEGLFSDPAPITPAGRDRPSDPEASRNPEPLPEPSAPAPPAPCARASANAGRLLEALAACDAALAVDRLDLESRHIRAAILEELGRLEEAVAALKQALYLEPDFVMAHVALGRLAERLGRAGLAARHFGIARRLLERLRSEETLPAADGMTVGSLQRVLANRRAKE